MGDGETRNSNGLWEAQSHQTVQIQPGDPYLQVLRDPGVARDKSPAAMARSNGQAPDPDSTASAAPRLEIPA